MAKRSRRSRRSRRTRRSYRGIRKVSKRLSKRHSGARWSCFKGGKKRYFRTKAGAKAACKVRRRRSSRRRSRR